MTGTAEKANFENDDNTYLIKNTANPFPRYVSNNPYSLANNSSARCLKMDITGKVDHVYCHFPAQLVGGRKYHVEWKSYVENTKNTTAYLYNLGSNSNYFNYGSSGVCKTWPTMSFDLVANKDRDNVGFGYCLATYWNTAEDLGSFSIYFDDIAVIPYYKVTYHVTDTSGTETVSTEYVLPADGLFVPNADIVGAAPTYTVNGNTYGITTAYALNNEDIEVYAVIPKTVEVAYVINRPSDVSSAYPVDVGMNDQNLSTPFTAESAICDIGSAVPELYIPGYSFLGWYNQAGGGERINYYTSTDTTLYAVWQKSKPGLNILTGTAEKADFENDDNTYLIKNADNPFPRYVSNNPYSLANNSSARCLKMDISGSVDHVYGNVSAQLVSGRKYHIEWKSYVEYTKNTMAYLYYFGTKNHYFDYGHSGTCRTWPTMSFDMTASENKNYVGFGYCFAASWNTAEDLGSFSVYFDDIAVIPYYKVTYHVTDLSGVETVSTEYVLPEDGLFIPNADIVGNAAVYTVNGHTYGMGTAYTLCNEDIDVYINFTDNVQTLTEHSIRTAGTQALRFSGSVSNDIIKCNENSSNIEFGFIVSRSDFMIAAAKKSGVDVNDYKTVLNFDEAKPTTNAEATGVYVNTYGLPFVYGPSFRWLCPTNETEEGTLEKNQTIQTETGDASFFTAALTGIPETYYKTPICGRTYVKIGELYFYGEVEETSVYDVAQKMLEDEGLDSETVAFLNSIIAKVDGTSTASET